MTHNVEQIHLLIQEMTDYTVSLENKSYQITIRDAMKDLKESINRRGRGRYEKESGGPSWIEKQYFSSKNSIEWV